LVTALFGLPYPLFGLFAGALVDRWDRRWVMITCEATSAIVTASIPIALWLHALTLVQLCLSSFLLGSLFVFFNVAEFAALPTVIPKEHFPQATAQNQATQGVAGFIGPPLGGFLFQVAQALPFVADFVSYAASSISLLFVRGEFRMERVQRSSIMADTRAGIHWLWGQRLMRTLTLLTAGPTFSAVVSPSWSSSWRSEPERVRQRSA
jgi:MFS family permease